MNTSLYRPDIKEACQRLGHWWKGGDIGRPAMLVTTQRSTPWENIPVAPQPEGWLTNYSAKNFDYRMNLAQRECLMTEYLGEAVPNASVDLGPNCLALYLGCKAEEGPGTVWFEPNIEAPEDAKFEYDPENFYWKFNLRLAKACAEAGKGRFIPAFPDLIEGVDTLAAMRGTQNLLMDLIERPEWVHQSVRKITDLYFRYYDPLYELIKDPEGGSYWWTWAPGRLIKMQCDFSAMISPKMFREFMVPILSEMSEKVDYCLYHWDGPPALPHHDEILSIKGIDLIQWQPGAGAAHVMDRKWWPLYHKTFEAGKKIAMIGLDYPGLDALRALKKEFGDSFGNFLIAIHVTDPKEAKETLEVVRL